MEGLDGVYAAGDATWYPIKQGGLAAQQADVVATAIAAAVGRAGAADALSSRAARDPDRRRQAAAHARRERIGLRWRSRTAVVAAGQGRGPVPHSLPGRAPRRRRRALPWPTSSAPRRTGRGRPGGRARDELLRPPMRAPGRATTRGPCAGSMRWSSSTSCCRSTTRAGGAPGHGRWRSSDWSVSRGAAARAVRGAPAGRVGGKAQMLGAALRARFPCRPGW